MLNNALMFLTIIGFAAALYFTSTMVERRVTKLETTTAQITERWVCSHTTRQRVLMLTEVSGAIPAYMDVCDEWKAK